MAQETEFSSWLEQGGANSKNGRATRIYAVRTIEKNLSALGMPYDDLESAWQADRFEGIYNRIKSVIDDAERGGQEFRILMPDSEKPEGRLSSWISWIKQYARFLDGEPPGSMKDADLIRQHVLEHYITPGRNKGLTQIDVPVGDVHEALGLEKAWPNVCQVLNGKKFWEMAEVHQPDRIGLEQSSTTIFKFNLKMVPHGKSERQFTLFDANNAPFQPVKNFNRTTGVSAYYIKPEGAKNKADEAIKTEDLSEVARAVLVDGLAARIKAIAGGPVNYLTYGGQKLVRYELDPEIALKIGVPARASINGNTPVETTELPQIEEKATQSMNLILYGPPGTGKTYTTAIEAVRLCGEDVPDNRSAVMARYKALVAAGRIEFVTFHQSMSYEDFVEGRQPSTSSDGDEASESAGFHLETVPGIFRRIAKRASTSRGHQADENLLHVAGRQVFKMSIGEANNPDDDHLFEEAIEGGYALLGYDDIDWSDEKYSSIDEMFETCKQEGNDGPNLNKRSGAVQMPFRFRNWAKKGDIVIVSKGNQHFRAIGEFTGDYEFHPRPEGTYAQRRAVNWLWIDREGAPVSEIYSRRFMMQSIYLLYDSELKAPALERYINSQKADESGEPEPFVLIIDEINRANISKVLGELITLLEADKRLGQPNELKVKLPYSGDEFGVPSNLHILGTMNTADRSIALLDTALRRRFVFREMMPDPSILSEQAEQCGIDLANLLATLNERIEYLFDREHQIGHAYFTGCNTPEEVDEVMRHKVIPLLAEYFFEDWTKIAAVLGDIEPHDKEISGGFLNRVVLKAPPGLEESEDFVRFRWEVRTEAEGFSYDKLVGA